MVGTVFFMEIAATLFHKHVMHGVGWGWHASHHVPRHGHLEKNDLYTLVFSFATIGLFALGGYHAALWWIAMGISVYGLLYGLLHDVLVHRRLPLKWQARSGYLKHLSVAHHLHHATRNREGCVSFGFLYAPPLDRLRSELKSSKAT